MCIGPTIHYNAGNNYIHTYIYIIVQELMNLQLCMEIGSVPRFVNPFSSVLTIMQDITTCMYMYIGTSAA